MHLPFGKGTALSRYSGHRTQKCLTSNLQSKYLLCTKLKVVCELASLFPSNDICYRSVPPCSLWISNTGWLVTSRMCHIPSLLWVFVWALLLAWSDSPFFCLPSIFRCHLQNSASQALSWTTFTHSTPTMSSTMFSAGTVILQVRLLNWMLNSLMRGGVAPFIQAPT